MDTVRIWARNGLIQPPPIKRLSQKGWNFFFNNIPPCRFSLFLILVCTNNRLKIIHNIRATALDKL
ncbi:hypothetical protein [Arsenophonus sp. ENCA]|uniref:hypothetical protein n=1 Tax=Arsenophonus sp. ENCA TaxID=1987579 RepID=UPI0025C155FD|nr:hypothetical protein [Arsenophonus sp. ENCA]